MSAVQVDTPTLAAGFLEILFDECDDLWIDVRMVEERGGGNNRPLWFRSPAELAAALPRLADTAYQEGRSLFFGVLPRKARGNGTREGVAAGWVAWADVDFKETPEQELDARLAAVPAPSITVRSGHGLHLYWLMQERTDPAVLEGLSQRIAAAIGADSCHDCARVLRLPGSLNLKEGWKDGVYTPPAAAPVVTMPTCDPSRRYNPHDFDMLPEVERRVATVDHAERRQPVVGLPPVVARLLRAHGWLRELWEGRGRSSGDTSNSGYDLALAGALTRCGVLDPDTLDAAVRARPYRASGHKAARTDRDVERVVDRALADARDRARREPRAPAAELPPPHGDDDMPRRADEVGEVDPPRAAVDVLDLSSERCTDLGNARVLVRLHGRDLRWCGAMPGDGWMVWDGTRWRADDTLAVRRLTDDVAEEWRRNAPPEVTPALDDDDKAQNAMRKAVRAHAASCESARSIRAMLEIARSRDGIASRSGDWDADNMRLNTPSATYDLERLRMYPPRREDLITRSTAVDASAEDCPAWSAFLWTVAGGTGPAIDRAAATAIAAEFPGSERARANLHAAELVAFLQRVAGYCLSGDTSEQCMFIAYGTGANGKGTFLNTIKAIMGDYAQGAQVATFTDRKAISIPNDLAALAGARMVLCSEPEEGAPLAEGLVKMVTGQDTITARFLNREFFDYLPRFKLWMMTNHKPVIKGTDNGIWRRLVLVPFVVTIPEHQRDKHLPDKLRAEYPAILRWMLDGLKQWRATGLATPDVVRAASAAYRTEMDVVGDFIADRCRLDEAAAAGNAELYGAYKTWATDLGLRPMSHKGLSRALQQRGLKQSPARVGGRKWLGIALVGDNAGSATRPPPRWDDG